MNFGFSEPQNRILTTGKYQPEKSWKGIKMLTRAYDVILDCYSDEPSGYGVPPFLGVHQRYISGALDYLNRRHFYVTIDDLRYVKGKKREVLPGNTNVATVNLTNNADQTASLLDGANTVHIVVGCFVDYEYVSAIPPRASELYELIKDFKARKVLYYVLGGSEELPSRFTASSLFKAVDEVVIGLSYNYLLKGQTASFAPNYGLLSEITKMGTSIIKQIDLPRIIEIESMIGCDWAKCSFCIEQVRGYPVIFRKTEDIVLEVVALYNSGARYFRIGRNPNFYYYMKQDVSAMEALLYGIRSQCPELRVLHIDNVNPESVVTPQGREITKLIVRYCTSGNIAPFGIESFDPVVREKNALNATVPEILEAIEIMNQYGQEKGEDGNPRFLNGINLIYNLPGQRPETHAYNLNHLSQIMDKGLQTQRLFFRRYTSPLGISMEESKMARDREQYENWKQQIYQNYTVPMLERIFPSGSILKNARVEKWKDGNSVLRQLGTCPNRIVVKDTLLPIGSEHDIVVQNVLEHRTLLGKPLVR